jgi:hypothetical protein
VDFDTSFFFSSEKVRLIFDMFGQKKDSPVSRMTTSNDESEKSGLLTIQTSHPHPSNLSHIYPHIIPY